MGETVGRSGGTGVVDLPLHDIDWDGADVVAAPPDPRPGAWAGAPTALRHAGEYWLAYRMRRPVGEGRGYANVVARSCDGVRFATVAEVGRGLFGAESLERPALVVTPQGRWRLYVSAALPGTKAWRVDLLEADTASGLASATPVTVLAPTPEYAPKDPVIRLAADGTWHLWASVHDLTDPDHTDRMAIWHATSPDGVTWAWGGLALSGRPGAWDARGVRPATVLDAASAPAWLPRGGDWVALYDGRATAEENWEEVTGVAVGGPRSLRAVDLGDGVLPLRSPAGSGGLRYLDVVAAEGGAWRVYAEVARPDGSHDLRTVLLPG